MHSNQDEIQNLNTTKFDIKFSINSLAGIGTCMIGNMLRCFHLNNHTRELSPWGIIPNPFVIKHEIRRLFLEASTDYILQNNDGTYSDPCRTWEKFNSKSDVKNFNKKFDAIALDHLKDSSALCIAYGLTEIWSPSDDIDIILNKVPDQLEDVQQGEWIHRLANIEMVKHCVFETINIIRDNIGPQYPIILCLCPSKLKYTYSGLPLETADNYSKSTLYTAIQMAVREFDKVIYFPTYEYTMISQKSKNVYQLDKRHYTANAIENYCRLFASFFQKNLSLHSSFGVPYGRREPCFLYGDIAKYSTANRCGRVGQYIKVKWKANSKVRYTNAHKRHDPEGCDSPEASFSN